MAVEKWTQERRRELTRTALVDAAALVFARRGFEGASLDEIAETAGFTRGAIYKNFGGKEDLFFAVFDRQIETNLAAFSDFFGDEYPIGRDPDQLAAAWQKVLARDVDTFALHLEFRLFALRNPEVRQRYADHHRREKAMITAFIEEQASASGVAFKLPAESVAGIMVAASEGFLAALYLDPEGESQRLFSSFLEVIVPAITVDDPNP